MSPTRRRYFGIHDSAAELSTFWFLFIVLPRLAIYGINNNAERHGERVPGVTRIDDAVVPESARGEESRRLILDLLFERVSKRCE